MTRVTLVAGGNANAREAVVARLLLGSSRGAERNAAIIEGVADQRCDLGESTSVTRLAPACPCCTGNLALRVALNRLLRRDPVRLVIAIAQAEHVEALRQFLTTPPYRDRLTVDLAVSHLN